MLPPHTTPSPRRHPTPFRASWKGGWLLAVAAVHTAFAAVVFLPQLQEIARRGVFDSVGTDPMVGAVAWFVLFGGVLALLGWAVLLLERHAVLAPVPLRPLGMGVLALTVLGIVLMPASGFWLALPPALALCRRPRR
ncbi:DUF6463 family protein [Acidovorax sp. FJL06]|uniref:DUF6463 family protein n=1 Tax=Acidovorax sp. FJL06 TaxID=2153365 RepID=UPI001F243520|nr:DUF6463 family protein [Acidovorax sp. FJL06]